MTSAPAHKKKLLLIIPNLGFGGAQRVFYDHSVALSEQYEVIECVFNFEFEHVYQSNNKIVSLDVPTAKSALGKISNFFKRISKLRQIKKQYNIDCAISHLEGADYINILSRQKEKIFCCIHGSKKYDLNIEGFIGWFRKKILITHLYKRADMLVCVSEDIKTELIRYFNQRPERVISIPNFIDKNVVVSKSEIDIEEPYKDLFSNHNIIITTARLSRQKNINPLIDIWKECKKKNANGKLVILGDGELRESLLDYAQQSGLKTYSPWSDQKFSHDYDLYFLGYQNNTFNFLSKSYLFVMTSLWEGFPMAICEALTVGVCTISSDCPTGPRQILNKESNATYTLDEVEYCKYGVLLPMIDYQQADLTTKCADLILKLLQDKETVNRYREASKIRAEDFSREKVIGEWIALINKKIQ